MKKTFFALALLLAGLTQHVQAEAFTMNEKPIAETPAGKIVEAYINLDSFDGISNDLVASIVVIQDDCSRIEAEGPERIISVIDASVQEGVLRITSTKDLRMKNRERLTLTVYTPTLCRIHQLGVGSIRCEGYFETPTMEIINDGVGSVKISDLHCDLLTVTSNGVGGIDLKGTTRKAIYTSDGVGSIEAYEMLSELTEVSLNGVGSIHCHASQRIDARNSGVGSIRYSGKPRKVNVHSDGIGSIRRR